MLETNADVLRESVIYKNQQKLIETNAREEMIEGRSRMANENQKTVLENVNDLGEKFSHLSLHFVARPVLIKKRGTIIDFRDTWLMNGTFLSWDERTE